MEALQREIQASDKKEFPDCKSSRTSTIIGGFETKVGQSIVWDGLRIPVLGKQVDLEDLQDSCDTIISIAYV